MLKLKKNGFLFIKNFFNKQKIIKIKLEMIDCFKTIYKKNIKKINQNNIDKYIIDLFESDEVSFLGWANICQNLLSFHRISNCKKIEILLKNNGLTKPTLNTRPLLSFSCKKLAKHESYWKIPYHQDWPSTRGSLNGVTIWTPLVNVSEDIGPLEIVPKSHLKGSLKHHYDGLAPIISKKQKFEFKSFPMNIGDLLIFNYFTIHRSGHNHHDNKIRWSAHFRYDDAKEKTFIDRKYPRYKKEVRLDSFDENFPKKEEILVCFK